MTSTISRRANRAAREAGALEYGSPDRGAASDGMPAELFTAINERRGNRSLSKDDALQSSWVSLDCQDKSRNSEPLSSVSIFASPTSRALIMRNILRPGFPS